MRKILHSWPKEPNEELKLRKVCPRLKKKVSSRSVSAYSSKLTITCEHVIAIIGDVETVEKFQKRLVSTGSLFQPHELLIPSVACRLR